MPAFLTNPVNILRGLAVLGILLVLGAFIWHYKSISDEAARVPGLVAANDAMVKQHARDDAEAAKAALQIVANEAARKVSLEDYHRWDTFKTSLGNDLEGLLRHEPITTDPGCLPTPADRKLWNESTNRLTADSGP